jgi:hypothetical protein
VDKLWIGNVPPGTSDAELLELVKKYSGLEGRVAEHVPGDGTRPAVVIEIAGAPLGAVSQLALRLQGMFWKDRAIHASTLQH